MVVHVCTNGPTAFVFRLLCTTRRHSREGSPPGCLVLMDNVGLGFASPVFGWVLRYMYLEVLGINVHCASPPACFSREGFMS